MNSFTGQGSGEKSRKVPGLETRADHSVTISAPFGGAASSCWRRYLMRYWLLTLLLLLAALAPGWAQANQQAAPTKLRVGENAPDFTLKDQNGNNVSLRDFRGKKSVVLAFYIFAFSGG
jgi:hypothetical protein